MKFKNFFLKSIPYILSILGGLIVYIVFVVNMRDDQNLNGLMSNVAASLLAIPLIFILYDYVSYKMSNRLNAEMEESLTFDVNSIVLKVLKVMRRMLGIKTAMSWVMLKRMLHYTAHEIKAAAKITDEDIAALKSLKKDLNDLSYKLVQAKILPESQVQLVIAITREMAHTVNEYEYKGKNSARLPGYIENLMDAIDDWFDSLERDSLQNHQQFQLSIEAEEKPGKKK